MRSPISPCSIRWCSSCKARLCRDIKPTPTFRFFAGFFSKLEHPPRSRAIRSQRFLHEDVEALLDGITKMNPAKSQRGRENDHVAGFEAIHGLLVTVESHELAIFGNVHLVVALFL